MLFYVGIHQPSDAKHFERSFISVNRIRDRKSAFSVADWIMDSGAFTMLLTHGEYLNSPSEYAEHIRRWADNGNLIAAVAQDYMCEPFMLERTGKNTQQHQDATIKRYLDLISCDTAGVPIMPVIQGYEPTDYARHVSSYGELLGPNAYVGVGSVCKRNTNVGTVVHVLSSIKSVRPDLRLHGFGLKKTALASAEVRSLLYSSDSMAWSFSARKNGRNPNDWREAAKFVSDVKRLLDFPSDIR